MKSLIINYLSILLCVQAFFACAPDVKKTPERTFRIIHNNDGSDLLGNRWFKYRPLTLADLDSCVDMVANSQVTMSGMLTLSQQDSVTILKLVFTSFFSLYGSHNR